MLAYGTLSLIVKEATDTVYSELFCLSYKLITRPTISDTKGLWQEMSVEVNIVANGDLARRRQRVDEQMLHLRPSEPRVKEMLQHNLLYFYIHTTMGKL